jgi:DNA invertase Pin-like site-specific DNA recombinase
MPLIGYARVSKADGQDPRAQEDALRAAGAGMIFCDTASGGTRARAQLAKALAQLAQGDTLLVWKVDRLARSLADLLAILGELRARGVGLRSLTEPIDTGTPWGEMVLQMLGAFAQFERGMIIERSRLGLERAKRNGVKLGRPRAARPDQCDVWAERVESGALTVRAAAHGLDVSLATMERILARRRKGGGDDKSKGKEPRAAAGAHA